MRISDWSSDVCSSDLADFVGGDFFAARRLVLIGNYTFTDSDIKVGPNDTTIPIGSGGMPVPATNLFTDGSRLTGQSRHLANLQIGLRSEEHTSELQSLMRISYAVFCLKKKKQKKEANKKKSQINRTCTSIT